MTAQISDSVRYRAHVYALAGVNGNGLFDPSNCGMKPIGRCTACWRGFLCRYKVDCKQKRLLLERLAVCLNEPATVLFEVEPKKDEGEFPLFSAIYEGLDYQVPYTGGLLLANDFVRELYVHMGFHPAWKYREVHEVIFENGCLIQEENRSEQMAELRLKIARQPHEPVDPENNFELAKWIHQCFSLDYSGRGLTQEQLQEIEETTRAHTRKMEALRDAERQRIRKAQQQQQAKIETLAKEGKACPRCGFTLAWNGRACWHCRYEIT